jgi:hypothetical protein
MADYAGAVAAIRARLVANWTTTPIAFQNENFDPPTDPNDGASLPWVFLEVLGNTSEVRTFGLPGSHEWLYLGHILVHVFVPVNSGVESAQQYASEIGEIFRAKEFCNGDPGSAVRSWSPRTDGGETSDDEGNWFRVTMTCPFEFLYRG